MPYIKPTIAHGIFVKTIIEKVKIYSRLKELEALSFVKYGNDPKIKQNELREQADDTLKNIENSLVQYLQAGSDLLNDTQPAFSVEKE